MVRANQTVAPEGTAATIQRVMLWIIPVGVLASGLLFNFPLGVLLYWFTSNLWTLGQQAYIIKYHPPTPKQTPQVGAVGKSLAPKPGARPQRDKPSLIKTVEPDTTEDQAAPSTPPPVRSNAPRPGQRPARGSRPQAKRPTQSKKRR
jgi:YidC/Oxa1 family membrane protein insertase